MRDLFPAKSILRFKGVRNHFMSRFNWYPFGDEVNYEPSPADAINILDKVMDELKASQNGQTFAFRSDTAEDVLVN